VPLPRWVPRVIAGILRAARIEMGVESHSPTALDGLPARRAPKETKLAPPVARQGVRTACGCANQGNGAARSPQVGDNLWAKPHVAVTSRRKPWVRRTWLFRRKAPRAQSSASLFAEARAKRPLTLGQSRSTPAPASARESGSHGGHASTTRHAFTRGRRARAVDRGGHRNERASARPRRRSISSGLSTCCDAFPRHEVSERIGLGRSSRRRWRVSKKAWLTRWIA